MTSISSFHDPKLCCLSKGLRLWLKLKKKQIKGGRSGDAWAYDRTYRYSALNGKRSNFVHVKIEASSICARMGVRCILPTL